MTKTTDDRFEVTVDQYGHIAIQPNVPGFSSDEVTCTVDEGAELAGAIMAEVIKYHLAKGFGVDLS